MRDWRPGCHTADFKCGGYAFKVCGPSCDLEGNKNSGVRGCNHLKKKSHWILKFNHQNNALLFLNMDVKEE